MRLTPLGFLQRDFEQHPFAMGKGSCEVAAIAVEQRGKRSAYVIVLRFSEGWLSISIPIHRC